MAKVPTFNKLDDFKLDQNFNYIQQILQNLSVVDNVKLDIARVADIRTSGTSGGNSVASAWIARVLNTVSQNRTFITLSENAMVVPAGRYLVYASSPFEGNLNAKTRIYDLTSAQTLLVGGSVDGNVTTSPSILFGIFTLQQESLLELQYYASGVVTDGLGSAALAGADGQAEVYTQIIIIKVG